MPMMASLSLSGRIKFSLLVMLHIFVAILGTALIETTVFRVVRSHSLAGLLWKEWAVSTLGAAILGFSLHRIWRTSTAKWAWTLPAVWFLLAILASFSSSGNQSVLGANHGFWSQFSGAGCAGGLQDVECRRFFLFTLTFVRSAGYSVGAKVSEWFQP